MKIDDLKCCGNCAYFSPVEDYCQLADHETRSFDACTDWHFDGISAEDRENVALREMSK